MSNTIRDFILKYSKCCSIYYVILTLFYIQEIHYKELN